MRGESTCLHVRMLVAHSSVFRFALASGTISPTGSGVYESGTPTITTAFDAASALLGEYKCKDLSSGCATSQSDTGDYVFNVTIPSTFATGVYTIQVGVCLPVQPPRPTQTSGRSCHRLVLTPFSTLL